MIQNLLSALKVRSLLVFLLVHIGLGLGIFALARVSFPMGWDLTSSLFLTSILCLYGGFVLSLAFVLWPLMPWIRRAQHVDHWSDRMIRDLPTLLEHLPKIIAAVKSLIATWNETKAKANTDVDHQKSS
ncbi:MAG: hypothetical protein AABZ55_15915 [Bdellovibrionota bacterium]